MALHTTAPRLSNLSYYQNPGSLALLGTELGKSFCSGRGKGCSVIRHQTLLHLSQTTEPQQHRIPRVNLSNYNVFETTCSFKEWRIGWEFLEMCLLRGYYKHQTKVFLFLLFKVLAHFTYHRSDENKNLYEWCFASLVAKQVRFGNLWTNQKPSKGNISSQMAAGYSGIKLLFYHGLWKEKALSSGP